MRLDYQPGFAIRGLHYDVAKGLLMKVDSFHQIQFGSVYRGLTSVPDEEVMTLYGQKHIPADYLEPRPNHTANVIFNEKLFLIFFIKLRIFFRALR